MTYIRHWLLAIESGWRAFVKQTKKRRTELRKRAAMPDPLTTDL